MNLRRRRTSYPLILLLIALSLTLGLGQTWAQGAPVPTEPTTQPPEATAEPTEPTSEETPIVEESTTAPPIATVELPDDLIGPTDPVTLPPIAPADGVLNVPDLTGWETLLTTQDFAAAVEWTYDAGAQIDGTGALTLTESAALRPVAPLSLSVQRIDTRFIADVGVSVIFNEHTVSTTTNPDGGPEAPVATLPPSVDLPDDLIGPDQIPVEITKFYAVSLEPAQTVLWRSDENGYTQLASTPTGYTPGAWTDASIAVVNGRITVSVNGTPALDYADAAPLAAGSPSVIANAGANVLVDVVNIYGPAADMVAEVTPEAPTPTLAPPTEDPNAGLNLAVEGKLEGAFARVMRAHLNGDAAAAQGIAADYFIEADTQGRYTVVLWGAPGITGDAMAAGAETLGGQVYQVGADYVEVAVTLDALATIISYDEITGVTMPERGVSTGSTAALGGMDTARTQNVALSATGSVIPHSLDFLGVPTWHNNNIFGAGVTIHVIATGFNTTGAAGADRSCLGSETPNGGVGTGADGINAVEVICDISPQAAVYMHTASNSAELATRINQANSTAVFPRANIIVVALDPGAGSVSEITNAVNAAYNNDIVIVAAAGNTGTGSAVSVDVPAGSSTFTVQASAGSVISYTWAGSDNIPTNLYTGANLLDSRSVPTSTQSQQYVVPASCGTSCELTLQVNTDVASSVYVRVMGGEAPGSVTPGPQMVLLESSAVTTIANLNRVISVGAVCAIQSPQGGGVTNRYEILGNSSRGPAGQPNTANIKPSLVAPSQVSTSLAQTSPNCGESGVGYTGTSASAAHIGGMIALMYANPNTANGLAADPAGIPQAVRAYLQTRTIDLSDTGFYDPDGYDNVYGAGLAQLGSPDFVLGFEQTLPAASEDTSGSIDPIYVTSATIPYTVGGTATEPDGSAANPYNSVAYALKQADAQAIDTVVLMPGEYVSSFAIPYSGISLVSYDVVDRFDRRPSYIWVNDTFFGIAGVYVGAIDGITTGGLSNVTLDGLTFVGAEPAYAYAVRNNPGTGDPSLTIADVRPFYVGYNSTGTPQATTGVSILNSSFENFDAPGQIGDSNDVSVEGSTFRNFEIGFDEGAIFTISRYKTSALEIADSGGVTPVIVDADFYDNVMETDNSNTWQEAVLGIERSAVEVNSSRFERNQSEALVTINQWKDPVNEPSEPVPADKLDYETIIYNTLFANNDVDGAIVQIYQNNRFRFVNNTVAGHELGGFTGNILTLGHENTLFLQVNDHQFEIHNNLFYHNQVEGALIEDIAVGQDQINIGCNPIDGTGIAPVSHNWFAPSVQGGECSSSIEAGNSAINSNVFTDQWFANDGTQAALESQNNPGLAAEVRANFERDQFFASFDPTNYYRLRPPALSPGTSDPAYVVPAVDAGSNTELEVVIGTYTFVPPSHFDVFGTPRVLDRTEPIVDTEGVVDIGAYELNNPDPVSIGIDPLVLTPITEDTEAVIFNLLDEAQIENGYRPYNFDFATPLFYDTDPFNDCGGQPILFNEQTFNVTYCPPKDFYSDGLADVSLLVNYTVSGTLETGTASGTFEVVVTPVNDGPPTVQTEKQIVFTEGGAPINLNLRPFASFDGGFFLSDPDMDDNPATPSDVDYPFTFAAFEINPDGLDSDGHNSDLFDATEIAAAFVEAETTGVLNVTPQPGEFGGFEFEYDVTDTDGQTATNARTVRIIVTERLATVGLHDDASIDFVYSNLTENGVNGWGALNYTPAINNTWHYTTTAGQSTEFFFVGDAFAAKIFGYTGAGTYNVELDLGDGTGYQAPNTIAGVTCSQTGTLSANRGTFGNFTYGCRGLDSIGSESVYRVRITSTSAAFFAIDAMEVRGEALGPGYYYEDDFFLNYTSGWDVYADPASGNSVVFSQSQGDSISFDVDGNSVDGLILHRVTYPGAGSFTVNINGIQTTVSNDSPFYWDTPYHIGGIGVGNITVTITHNGTTWDAINAIELVGADRALTQGVYALEDPRIDFVGDWDSYADTFSPTGTTYYSLQQDSTILLTTDATQVDRLTIYHTDANWGGTLRVCGASCQDVPLDGPLASTVRLSDLSVLGNANATISISTGQLYAGVRQVQLWNSATALSAGEYQEYHPSLNYGPDGAWATYSDAALLGGSNAYVVPGAEGFITFSIDNPDVDRIAVLHSNWAGTGELCQNIGSATLPVYSNCQPFDTTNSRTSMFTTQALGLAGGVVNLAIRADNTNSNNYVAIEGIELIDAETLGIGSYDYNSEDLQFVGRWFEDEANPSLYRDAGANYSIDPGNRIAFNIDATQVRRIKVYHTAWNFGGGTFAQAQLCVDATNDCQTFTLNDRSQTYFSAGLNLTGTNEAISIRVVGGAYVGFEGLELLGLAAGLTPGTYEEDNPELDYSGAWLSLAQPGNFSGDSIAYSQAANATVAFTVDATQVNRIGIAHANYGGVAQICKGSNENCVTINTTDRGEIVTVQQLGLTTAVERVTLRVNSGTVGLDAITLIGDTTALTPDTYEYDDDALSYVGPWFEYSDSVLRNSEVRYSLGAGEAVTFPVDATQTTAITVFHMDWAVGNAQLCANLNGSCQAITASDNVRSTTVEVSALGLTGADAWVTLRVVNGFFGFEGVQLTGASPAALSVGLYQDTDGRLTYEGNWAIYTPPVMDVNNYFVGGTVTYSSTANDYVGFTVDATASDSLTVYHASWGAAGEVCAGTETPTNCQNFNTGAGGDTASTVSFADLGISGAAEPVSVRVSSGFLGFEAVRINGTPEPLTPGYYEEDHPQLIYDAAQWPAFPSSPSVVSGGSGMYALTTDAEMTFRIGGGTSPDQQVTGFVVYVLRYVVGADVNVCYTRESTGTTYCSQGGEAVTSNAAFTQPIYGLSFYGLPPLTEDESANETYTVTVTKLGPETRVLVVDSVTVLGTIDNVLTADPDASITLYDDTDEDLQYGPRFWDTFNGAPGFYEGTLTYTNRAGAPLQLAVDGEQVTVYPYSYNGGSRDVRFCRLLDSGATQANQCANFAVNFSNQLTPITLFGFGAGRNDLVIENRDGDSSRYFIIDAIEVE